MTVTSFGFLLLLGVGILIYYIVPKKVQWVMLLFLSLIFYYFAATPYTIIFLMLSTIIAYISTNLMVSEWTKEKNNVRYLKLYIAGVAIFLNILIWFVLKGTSFWMTAGYLIKKIIPPLDLPISSPFIAALGMGYYTAQVIGYILDVYWEIIEPQRNPLKLFLFVCFFPQLTVGPISKYSQLQSLYEGHKFRYENFCMGAQRILWGFFKKIVISDRIAIIVNAIWADTMTYSGIWPWIAVLLYPLEIYTDFSGCVDIVLGAAELFDIRLPENFNNPFFSCSVQEFWQRWHITLGTWAKDYIYYPVLKSRALVSLNKWTKKHFKKKMAKFIPWSIGMGILWFVMGVWHGSFRHIVGVSVWYWFILVISELFTPYLKKIIIILKIDAESFSWCLFQRIRTYLIFAIGCVFFSSEGVQAALKRYKLLFMALGELNPWTLFDGSIVNLGVTWGDINIIILGIYLLVKVANLREKYGCARTWICKQILPFRWSIWLGLFIVVLIYGLYGPGYDASQFIYQGF